MIDWCMNSRIVRDYERLPQHSEAHLNWALISMMTRRLTGKSPAPASGRKSQAQQQLTRSSQFFCTSRFTFTGGDHSERVRVPLGAGLLRLLTRRRRGCPTPARPIGLADRHGRIRKGDRDVFGIHLDDRAALSLVVVEGPLLESSADDDTRALGQRPGSVLGGLPPQRTPQEQRFTIYPLRPLTVIRPRRGRHRETGHWNP